MIRTGRDVIANVDKVTIRATMQVNTALVCVNVNIELVTEGYIHYGQYKVSIMLNCWDLILFR